MRTILQGIVGSTAYGLHTPASDIDRMGVFVVPTPEVVGLGRPRESVVTTKPDITQHEIKKFLRLVLNGNPSVNELLWLEDYEVVSYEWGAGLLALRQSFLSARRVRDAYLGYATQQFRDLERRDGTFGPDLRKRTEKHARHLRRLVDQGYDLYTTGTLLIRVQDPEAVHEFGRQVAAEVQREDPDQRFRTATAFMEEAKTRFDLATTVLPEHPDTDRVNRWLVQLRKAHWEI
jgi:hypothetical protein